VLSRRHTRSLSCLLVVVSLYKFHYFAKYMDKLVIYATLSLTLSQLLAVLCNNSSELV